MKTKLDNMLSNMVCPHCGEVGHLHGEISATCHVCGTHMDASEMAELIDSKALPQLQSLQSADRLQTLPDNCLDSANFADSEETLRVVDESNSLQVLTGEATIRYLDDLGAAFSLVRRPGEIIKQGTEYVPCDGKEGINPRSDDGMDELNYLDTPMNADAAIAHLKRKGNVGILPEHSTGLIVIDIDAGAEDFIREYGALAMGAHIHRTNAPNRVKLIVLCPDAGNSMKLESADEARRIEIISKRKQAIIAGIHETGATIACKVAHELPLVKWSRLVEIAHAWTGVSTSQNTHQATSLCASSAVNSRAGSNQLKAAIIWWCQQPQNIAAVDALVRNHAKGKYIAVRPERTPSTRITGEHDGRRTWRDYGSNETLDDYEIYCRLNGYDKRTHKWQVVNEWRTAHGKEPMRLQQSSHEHFPKGKHVETQL